MIQRGVSCASPQRREERRGVHDWDAFVLAKHQQVVVLADEDVSASGFRRSDQEIVLRITTHRWYIGHGNDLGAREEFKHRLLVRPGNEPKPSRYRGTLQDVGDFAKDQLGHVEPVACLVLEYDLAPNATRIQKTPDEDYGIEDRVNPSVHMPPVPPEPLSPPRRSTR